MFYHAEFHSCNRRERSISYWSSQLHVSSVFAWQTAIQSTRADMCECTDALLLAFCAPARMDWHIAMLMIFETGWSRIQDVDWFKCCTFEDNYEKNKWIWWKTITEMDSMVYLACVFRFFLCVSACQMGVFLFWLKESHSDVKSQFRWPAPGLFDRHTAILTKCDSPFSEPAPLKFLTPTPRWMAIGFLFWLIVVKPRVEMEKKKAWQEFKVTLLAVFTLLPRENQDL